LHITKNMAYGLMVLAAFAWGTSGTLTELAIDEGATPNVIALYSEIFSGIMFFVVVLALDRPSLRMRREDLLPFFVFTTITGALFSLAWYH
jgi:drug/metabolite transporter (DMT)-like permease